RRFFIARQEVVPQEIASEEREETAACKNNSFTPDQSVPDQQGNAGQYHRYVEDEANQATHCGRISISKLRCYGWKAMAGIGRRSTHLPRRKAVDGRGKRAVMTK